MWNFSLTSLSCLPASHFQVCRHRRANRSGRTTVVDGQITSNRGLIVPNTLRSQLSTSHTSIPLSSTARLHHDDGQGQPGFGAGSCRRRTKVTACYCRSQGRFPFYPTRSCERRRIHRDESLASGISSAVRGEGLGRFHPGDVRDWNTHTEQVHTINSPQYHPP